MNCYLLHFSGPTKSILHEGRSWLVFQLPYASHQVARLGYLCCLVLSYPDSRLQNFTYRTSLPRSCHSTFQSLHSFLILESHRDSSAKLLLVPNGALSSQPSGAIQAAQKLGILVGEVTYLIDRCTISLDIPGHRLPTGTRVETTIPNEDDVMLLLHTSGTTGKPKGLFSRRLSHS